MDNLETFPSIIDDLPSSVSRTAFNPSSLPTGPGIALPPGSSAGTTLTAPGAPSSSAAVNGSATSTGTNKTTLISASHMWPSRDPSATEWVVTSTVDGSETTVTVTNTAEAAAQPGSSAVRGAGTAGTAAGAALLAVAVGVTVGLW